MLDQKKSIMNDEEDAGDDPTILAPPRSMRGIALRLGPGMIIAGSIVGSGELIATTKVGAEAGFWLLWLILIGCVIKVFTQIEFGRFSIVTGETTLSGLNQMPGPRWRVNWLLWYWLIMTLLALAQQGGIVGGVGQALAISRPITASGKQFNAAQDQWIKAKTSRAILSMKAADPARADEMAKLDNDIKRLRGEVDRLGEPLDPYIWAGIIAVITSIILVKGRYGLIQTFATIMVVSFTLVTILTVVMLQNQPDWAVQAHEIKEGLSFHLPPALEGRSRLAPLATAMAAFGIIGVGSAELIIYPYWCQEKGYARFTGPRDASPEWAQRARGWLHVMKWDAWCSMVVYTFATVAFYLLGAAVLGRTGLNPDKNDMIRTLTEMYVPVFGKWAPGVFLFGAFAVLYSTFFVACAGTARLCADAVRVFGVGGRTPLARLWWTRFFSGFFPLFAFTVYAIVRAPVGLILTSGIAQAIMLPMLGAAALFFRYRRGDPRIPIGRLWDLFLWISFFGLLLVGVWSTITLFI